MGTGELAFEALEPGDEILFCAGPQGGHHVYVSMRTTGLVPGTGDLADPGDPVVTIGLVADGKALSTFEDRARAFATMDEGMELLGQLVVLARHDPPALDGAAALLSAQVQDRCGSVVVDEVDTLLALAVGR